MVNLFWLVSLGGCPRSRGAKPASWAWGCRLVVESWGQQEHPVDGSGCGCGMIEKIRVSCPGLRRLRRLRFGWQGRGFHSRDLFNNGDVEWRQENKAEKRDARFLRVGTMVSSHEGTIGNADCGVAVRAMQNWKWKGSRYVGGRVSKKNKKDISWAKEERRGL